MSGIPEEQDHLPHDKDCKDRENCNCDHVICGDCCWECNPPKIGKCVECGLERELDKIDYCADCTRLIERERETGRCGHCGRLLLECNCD